MMRKMKTILEKLVSITVTYNPTLVDNILEKQLSILSKFCKNCIVIDNGSTNVESIRILTAKYKNVTLIELHENLGIAAALNYAVDYCKKIADVEWIITMDQDSYFKDDETIYNIANETLPFLNNDRVVAFGFNYEDFHFTKKKLTNHSKGPIYVHFLITSGCIVRKDIIETYGFDSDLFMYNVDTDFCRRLNRDGFKLVLVRSSFMFHKGGAISLFDNNVEYHYNEPEKFYFFGRNSLIMLKRYFDLRGIAYVSLLLMENVMSNKELESTFKSLRKGIIAGFQYILGR